MKTSTLREAESVTRSIARWSSAAAALIFGIGFVTDDRLSWEIVTGQAAFIVLTTWVFAGYALAWTARFEVLGSLIALAGVLALSVYSLLVVAYLPWFTAAIGLPAAFHLTAVALHRRRATQLGV